MGEAVESRSTPSSSSKPAAAQADASSSNGKKTFDTEYKRGKTLGEGAFSVVVEATKKSSGESFAVKVVTKNKLTKEDEVALKDEIQVLRTAAPSHHSTQRCLRGKRLLITRHRKNDGGGAFR